MIWKINISDDVYNIPFNPKIDKYVVLTKYGYLKGIGRDRMLSTVLKALDEFTKDGLYVVEQDLAVDNLLWTSHEILFKMILQNFGVYKAEELSNEY